MGTQTPEPTATTPHTMNGRPDGHFKATTRSTKRHRWSTATAAVLAPATMLALVACSPSENAEQDDHSELQAMADNAVEHGVPGVVIRVDDGGEPYTVTAAADWAEPVSADDVFRVASNSKTATAVLILQLVDDGAVDLDAPLSTWFDDLPNADAMTVRTLLNHTSGLGDFVYDPDVLPAVAGLSEELPTPDELVAAGLEATEAAGAADGYRYSNTGYTLLGQIVEQATGHSLADRFETNVARPLGLAETRFPSPGSDQEPGMHGYEPDAEGIAPLLPEGTPEGFGFAGPAATDGWVEVTGIDQSWEGAAGSMISTPAEWATFQRAVLAGDLFSGELLEQMRTTVPEDGSTGPGRSYGLGLERVETDCGVVWGHDGALPGYSTDTYVDDLGERSMTVVSATYFGLLAQPDAGTAHKEMVNAAACAMYGQPIPTPGA